MPHLRSLDAFEDFRKLLLDEPGKRKPCLVICAGTGGQASGANDLIRIIKRQFIERNLQDELSLRITGCLGYCEMDPFILVEPGNQFYPKLDMNDVPRVIDAALQGRVLDDLLYRESESSTPCGSQADIPFFRGQKRVVLGENQFIDPIRILNYMRRGGYEALGDVLDKGDGDWVVDQILESGLRGRGGAGFPTGKKWKMARAAGRAGEPKYLVCNADEGDPGAYMDRSLLEGNPHAILEGMIIGGYAIGATRGIIYVRSEYPLAIKHSLIAIRQARELGLLGDDILGTGFGFDVDIVQGAGAFVCGEETALIRSIEGQMGEPRQRPPYPISHGIRGHSTCINNVETLGNIPIIIRNGAASYRELGIEGNTGTKIFSLVGKIRNTGLVEVPLGTPIAKVVYDIGGGAPGGNRIKAVQTGGPSGGCIPASMFDLSIDYDSLKEAGSIMGSGGMIVMDENTCMVDVARYFMSFLKDESCGKCLPCRKGTQRMYELLDDITRGQGTLEHLDLLEELADVVADTTMCGLGQSAPNPVKGTLRYFREEYLRHILDKRCDAFVCKDLVGAPCATACPLETEAWRYVAHVGRNELDQAYRAIRISNPLPAVAARVCHHPCEQHCRAGTSGGQPIAIRTLKRYVTDRVPPRPFFPEEAVATDEALPPVAIVGAGPAGLSAAHFLSRQGIRSTLFDAGREPGGMLIAAIPAYRLPRDVVRAEIAALIDERVAVECGMVLGEDFSLDDLRERGYGAVFLAIGAHRSGKLGLPGEQSRGVYPSIEFLKAFHTDGRELVRGRVGVIGGGNSAVDAARIALRLDGVEDVTIFYRRTRAEMPAFAEEVEDALEEGVRLESLVSPTAIIENDGAIAGLRCIRNELGARDASGRRRPVPIQDSEFAVELDALIVAIGERPDTNDIEEVAAGRLEVGKNSCVHVERRTLATSIEGVFAGGDAVTGPNTVVDAMAHGKRAAEVIGRYLRGEQLAAEEQARLPRKFIAPVEDPDAANETGTRVATPKSEPKWRRRNFVEVESSISSREAIAEAHRCLRCDLEFTENAENSAAAETESKGAA